MCSRASCGVMVHHEPRTTPWPWPRKTKLNQRKKQSKIKKSVELLIFPHSKTSNNRTGGANNEYRGGSGGPGSGFCSPGGGFSSFSRRSGLPLRLLPLKPPPGLQKPLPGPPGPPLYSLFAPPCTRIRCLRV